MSEERVVILDGTHPGEEDLAPVFSILLKEIKASGAQIQVFSLRHLKLAYCIGDFGCWVEKPGVCRFGEAAGREILQSIIQSDTTILFAPVVFGGYSSQLKQIVDRFASLLLPYFSSYHGEMHHRPRYPHFPRLVGVGVQTSLNAVNAHLFKIVVGRNAINFHASSFAAGVVQITDSPEYLREELRSLLTRKDPSPWGPVMRSITAPADAYASRSELDGAYRALLIVGSPKTLSPSTSSVLGNYLLDRLKEYGWETDSLTLKPSLQTEKGQTELLAAVDRADLLLFAFPLYIDTLPFLMTRALEVIAEHRLSTSHPRLQLLFAISNNGFVESYQNNLALAICQRFAAETGMAWMGGLAMGAGEAISGGQPLKPFRAFGVPCAHVIRALDVAGAALAQGQAVPAEASQGIARNPIPHAPFAAWRWIAAKTANRQMWDKRAAENGLSKSKMLAQPYRNMRN